MKDMSTQLLCLEEILREEQSIKTNEMVILQKHRKSRGFCLLDDGSNKKRTTLHKDDSLGSLELTTALDASVCATG